MPDLTCDKMSKSEFIAYLDGIKVAILTDINRTSSHVCLNGYPELRGNLMSAVNKLSELLKIVEANI